MIRRSNSKGRRISSILVANRGEIALRIFRTCDRLGIISCAVASAVDSDHPHAREASKLQVIGNTPRDVYLNPEGLVQAALELRADAIHPGYGYLSERPEFARLVEDAGLIYLGPTAETLSLLGSKSEARLLAQKLGVFVSPGFHEPSIDDRALIEAADQIGYPLMIKAVAGGGGRGMRLVRDEADLAKSIAEARAEAKQSFGDARLLLEKLVERARHIEVQLLGDGRGQAFAFGERDCTLQRRYQKVIEEAPAPNLSEKIKAALHSAAIRMAEAAKLRSLATAEFLVFNSDQCSSDSDYVFLEVNGRLQVEHPVTELIYGVDLVECQIRIAEDGRIPERIVSNVAAGHAIEVRVYAESPRDEFVPSPGLLRGVELPIAPGIRIDHILATGEEVTTDFDPMIAKVIGSGVNREQAIERLRSALFRLKVENVETNIPLLLDLLSHSRLRAAEYDTGSFFEFVEEIRLLQSEQLNAALAVAVGSMRHLSDRRQNADIESQFDPFLQLQYTAVSATTPAIPPFTIRIRTSLSEYQGEISNLRFYYGLSKGSFEVDGMSITFERSAAGRHCVNGKDYIVLDPVESLSPGARCSFLVGGVWFEAEVLLPNAAMVEGTNRSSPIIRAQIPGKVARILVSEGQLVSSGTVLLYLDSMKIEHAVCAHENGTIERILVGADEIVRAGSELITYSR